VLLRYEPCAARINAPLADRCDPGNRSGAHQPAVVWESRLRGRFGTQSRHTSRAIKSGGRQPAVDVVTASATAFVHGRPAGRRCAAIVVLPLQARYTNHGWLTPAAPDARRRCTEKNDIRGAQSHVPKSGGRQPAVVRESRWQRRPVFAGGLHLHRTSGFRTTAGLRQPLLMHDVGALKKRHSRCTIACSQERRASARRGRRTEPLPRYARCAARINALLADDATPPEQREPWFAIRVRENHPVRRAASARNSRWQRRPVFANGLHLHRTSGSRTTAGLRQPLLMHDVGALKKTTFAVHNRMFPESGGRQPAVVCYKNAVPQESTHC
jgi:hypothetical protein